MGCGPYSAQRAPTTLMHQVEGIITWTVGELAQETCPRMLSSYDPLRLQNDTSLSDLLEIGRTLLNDLVYRREEDPGWSIIGPTYDHEAGLPQARKDILSNGFALLRERWKATVLPTANNAPPDRGTPS